MAGSNPMAAAVDGLLNRAWLRNSPATPVQQVQLHVLPALAPTPPCRAAAHDAQPAADACTASAATATSHGGGSSSGSASAAFYLLRDDLLHPVLGGNKVRKLDALMPDLVAAGCTDVVTCGGLQSAHTASVAVAASELGMRAHLLVRGERPQVPTGYHLVCRMHGDVRYVSRQQYADRTSMLQQHVQELREEAAAHGQHVRVEAIPEGGAEPRALLGLLRLVHWLALSAGQAAAQHAEPQVHEPQQSGHSSSSTGGSSSSGSGRRAIAVREVAGGLPAPAVTPYRLVADSGTGATAVGLALAVALLGLPWKVTGVMVAGSIDYYQRQANDLPAAFMQAYTQRLQAVQLPQQLPLDWVERPRPRKFGRVLAGDIATCQQVARACGVPLDPIYSLAAWEVSCQLAAAESQAHAQATAQAAGARDQQQQQQPARCTTVMLHGGGALGLHGLAQRFAEEF